MFTLPDLKEALKPIETLVGIAAKEALAEAAIAERDRVLSQQLARAGIAPVFSQIVDGVEGKPLSEAMNRVVLNFSYLPEVVRDTRAFLIARSPRLKGEYIGSIVTLVDGVEVSGHAPEAGITWQTQVVQLLPTVAYSRRLEVGKTHSGRAWVKSVEPHIVEQTAVIQRSIFTSVAEIQFRYVELDIGHQLTRPFMYPRHFENGRWRHGKSIRTRHGFAETHVLYPCIEIRDRN